MKQQFATRRINLKSSPIGEISRDTIYIHWPVHTSHVPWAADMEHVSWA